jgi:hypothetical protein
LDPPQRVRLAAPPASNVDETTEKHRNHRRPGAGGIKMKLPQTGEHKLAENEGRKRSQNQEQKQRKGHNAGLRCSDFDQLSVIRNS